MTTLSSESSVNEHHECQNPFTVPVAMLLYRVARNLKYNSVKRSFRPVSIQILLQNCLKILNETKHPQVTIYAVFNFNYEKNKLKIIVSIFLLLTDSYIYPLHVIWYLHATPA